MKRVLLILLALPLLPLLLVAGFYGYENVGGAMAWHRARAALVANGEPLRLDALRPQPVADEENMAFAPIFRDLFIYNDPANAAVSALQLPGGNSPASAGQARVVLLAHRFDADFSGDTGDAARVVLDGIAHFGPVLDAVASAASRPGLAWPVNFSGAAELKMPFLPALRRTAEVLSARGTAAIAAGDSRAALRDFELITRLADCANQPAVMAGCITQARILDLAVELVNQGLMHQAWTDGDLRLIDAQLADFRPINAFRESLRGERAFFFEFSRELTGRTATYFSFIDFRTKLSEQITRGVSDLAWNLRPSGWLARDRTAYANLTQEWLTHVIHNGFVRPWALADWTARMRDIRRNPVRLFQTPVTATTLPTFANVARSAAYAQARIDLARIACAVERHRRDTGRLPADLATLAPSILDPIPRDVIGGGRYFYRPSGDHSYVLYSKGWNGRDDGGTTGSVNPLLGMPAAKDWVWDAGSTLTAGSMPVNPAP